MTEYHYVYMISYSDVQNVYYGSRTSKCLPEDDINYWGSPKTFKVFMDEHRNTRVKTILATGFETRSDAIAYENDLIQKQWDKNKLLSLNASISGEKFNTLGMKVFNKHKINSTHTIETRQKMSKAHMGHTRNPGRYFVAISPTGEHILFRNVLKFCRENPDLNLSDSCISDCLRIDSPLKSHKGWRFFSKEDYESMDSVIPKLVNEWHQSYLAISPEGDQIFFTNAQQFIREYSE